MLLRGMSCNEGDNDARNVGDGGGGGGDVDDNMIMTTRRMQQHLQSRQK